MVKGCSWQMSGHRKRRGQTGLNNVKSETVVPTETSLHHKMSDQSVALNSAEANRAQDYSVRRRGGLCVYSIDSWCSISLMLNLRYERCRSHYHHHHFAAVYIYPDAYSYGALRVYVYLYITNCTWSVIYVE